MSRPRVPGILRGAITIVSDDDEHLKDFAEYMPDPHGPSVHPPVQGAHMEDVVEFTSDGGREAAEQFQQWQADHPNGYYINVKSGLRGMPHRVNCFHVGGAGEWNPDAGDVTRRAKLCSDSRESLTRDATARLIDVVPCAHCKL